MVLITKLQKAESLKIQETKQFLSNNQTEKLQIDVFFLIILLQHIVSLWSSYKPELQY